MINTPVIPFASTFGNDPKEGPKSSPMRFDFTAAPVYTIDFTQFQQQNQLTLIQTVFIDNTANTSPTSLIFDGTDQTLIAPALSQGYYPILTQKLAKATIASSGAFLVKVQFINVPIPPSVWYSAGIPGSTVTIGGPNPLPVAVAAPANTYYGVTQATMTGASIQLSTILPAGSPTSLKSLTLQGFSTNASIIDLGSSAGVTVGTGIEIAAGGFQTFEAIDTTKMFVIGVAATKLNIQAVN